MVLQVPVSEATNFCLPLQNSFSPSKLYIECGEVNKYNSFVTM